MLKAKIFINLREGVCDPQGVTIKRALAFLGYKNLGEVRAGKMITMNIDCKNKKEAESQIDKMCGQLLVNSVIEDYDFLISEE